VVRGLPRGGVHACSMSSVLRPRPSPTMLRSGRSAGRCAQGRRRGHLAGTLAVLLDGLQAADAAAARRQLGGVLMVMTRSWRGLNATGVERVVLPLPVPPEDEDVQLSGPHEAPEATRPSPARQRLVGQQVRDGGRIPTKRRMEHQGPARASGGDAGVDAAAVGQAAVHHGWVSSTSRPDLATIRGRCAAGDARRRRPPAARIQLAAALGRRTCVAVDEGCTVMLVGLGINASAPGRRSR